MLNQFPTSAAKRTRPIQVGAKSRFLAGWSLVLLYIALCSPVGTTLTALAGAFDSHHQVALQVQSQGLQVVLHHEPGCTAHQHGPLAKVLTCFAQPSRGSSPDHVIQFSDATSLRPAPATARISTDLRQSPPAPVEPTLALGGRSATQVASIRIGPAGPEPLGRLRSTQLLL